MYIHTYPRLIRSQVSIKCWTVAELPTPEVCLHKCQPRWAFATAPTTNWLPNTATKVQTPLYDLQPHLATSCFNFSPTLTVTTAVGIRYCQHPSMMASTPSAKPGRILAKAMSDRLGYGGPDDCITSIRCNGRELHVDMSPFYICNSPAVESRYRKFITAVRYEWESDTLEGEHPEDVMDDFHAWLIDILEPIFLEVAPDIPPSFDPAKIATGEAHPLLSEYFFPEEYCCRLEVENDKPFPILMRDEDSP